jgi:hypothetical protein
VKFASQVFWRTSLHFVQSTILHCGIAAASLGAAKLHGRLQFFPVHAIISSENLTFQGGPAMLLYSIIMFFAGALITGLGLAIYR